MRLAQLKVSHFRCYKTPTSIDFDNLTILIGRNDAGKSSLLDALGIFFDEVEPDPDDLCVHHDNGEVRITCAFKDLPATIVIDVSNPTSLADEHLLNTVGHLELTRVFECGPDAKKFKDKGVFARAYHPGSKKYDDLLSLTNTQLKTRAKDVGANMEAVDQKVNTQLRRAIWATAPQLEPSEREIVLKPDIWDQLKKYLPQFALFKSDRPSTDQDSEAQDPMKLAIKEAIQTQKENLDAIAKIVEDEVQAIANQTVEKIKDLDPDLASQLNPRISNKNWDTLFNVSLTGDDAIPINKRGSGTRRLVLLSFFRAQAERDAANGGGGIIYAVEEPETSQHPNNQKLLVAAFDDLSQKPDCQVILTTHTPVLARRFSRTALRFVSKHQISRRFDPE